MMNTPQIRPSRTVLRNIAWVVAIATLPAFAQTAVGQQQNTFQNDHAARGERSHLAHPGVLGVGVLGNVYRIPFQQLTQVLNQQVVIQRIGVVIVGFYPLFHGQVGLITVVAIFGDHTNLTCTQFCHQLFINGLGYKTFARRGRAGNTDDHTRMLSIRHDKYLKEKSSGDCLNRSII